MKTMFRVIGIAIAFWASGASGAPFVPGTPCMGCELEIYDHGGVVPTAKNAVFRVERPRTPMGDAPL